jgi:eukaryotic-like serine/threonine-protein kinase
MTIEGKKIGAYNVLDEIGSGGMAVVYKAEQPALGRLVAIKELRKELAADASLITRFEREAKSVAALAHQNIVHIYDFLTRGTSMFIVMEFVEGIDVYELLTKVERLPPEIAAIIALQAARALEYAHYRGVVHRDFKPSNLMITKMGEVKLMDFGIARDEAFDDLTRPGTAIGTPAYMSPEQIMGERVDFRSDIFSFGIVLYQMLTGQKPFVEDDTKSVMQRILNEPYERPRKLYPDIPWKLQRIVKRCLQKEPGKRYKSTELLRRELEQYVASSVRINYNGRLVIYLRNRDVISDSEASTYVRDEELKSLIARSTDTGVLSSGVVVFRPLVAANAFLLALLGGWALVVDAAQLGIEHGFVRVNALPWAEVWVDGQLHDTTPFVRPIALTPGKHELEFRNTYFEAKQEIVDVVPGETHVVHVELSRRK